MGEYSSPLARIKRVLFNQSVRKKAARSRRLRHQCYETTHRLGSRQGMGDVKAQKHSQMVQMAEETG